MSANLRLEGNFLKLVKDLFTSDIRTSVEHSGNIFKIFDGIILKGVVILLLIELMSLRTSAFVTS